MSVQWKDADQVIASETFEVGRSAGHHFKDHAGHEAVSFYIGKAPSRGKAVLPPLWSYQVYVTCPESDLLGVARFIREHVTASMLECFSHRIDSYNLTDASLDDCINHYIAESQARRGSPQAIPEYKGTSNYLILIQHPDWKTRGVTVAAWETTDSVSTQDGVLLDLESSLFSGDAGFVEDDGEGGNLGDALVSLWPFRHEDEDYLEALYLGRETWEGCESYRRNPDLCFGWRL